MVGLYPCAAAFASFFYFHLYLICEHDPKKCFDDLAVPFPLVLELLGAVVSEPLHNHLQFPVNSGGRWRNFNLVKAEAAETPPSG